VSIASRIIILFLSLGLFLVSIATGYVTQRDYHATLDGLVENAVKRTQNRPDLEFAFYRLDGRGLEDLLGDFLDSDALTQAAAFSGIGDELAARSTGTAAGLPVPHSSIRDGSSVADIRLVALDEDNDTAGTGFWSALIAGTSRLYLSVPVFSSVTPTTRGLGLADFVVARSADRPSSLVVLGFVNLTIDRGVLLRKVAPTAALIFAGGIVLLLLCNIPAYLYTWQLTAPI
jgi:hypothetical protein